MGCSGCSPQGCGDKGHCSTGSCNKMNTYDWINALDLDDPTEYQFVEVSFKNGAHKDFYHNDSSTHCSTGDLVLVETTAGYDIGTITLSGELVRMQMKKKRTYEDRISQKIIRRANDRDLEKLTEARSLEKEALIRARAIATTLDLDMKLGDVEYQGDMKKATFYYTANGRVDFRELVRIYAKEFRVKIEMRQIGSRQESARLGGIGSCGRELCCSTWLSDFRSVNTAAARYQNIAINQTKLSGQCGRLKCCLNYELDTYMDAIKHFPNRADHLMTKKGRATLMKTDIFKGLMFYSYDDITMRGVFHPLDKDKVKEILEMNKKGVHPEDLVAFVEHKQLDKEAAIGYEDVTGAIELPDNKKKKKKKRPGQDNRQNQSPRQDNQKPRDANASSGVGNNAPASEENKGTQRNDRNQQKHVRDRQQPHTNAPQNKQELRADSTASQTQKNGPDQNQKPNQGLPKVEKKHFAQRDLNTVQKPPQNKPKPPHNPNQPPPTTNIEAGEVQNSSTGETKKNFKKKKFFKHKNKNNNNQSPPAGA